MNERKVRVDKEAPFLSGFPKNRGLRRGCPFKVGLVTEKRRKGHPNFGYMQHHFSPLFLLAKKNISKGRPQWKKRVPSLQGFQHIGVSGVGVPLGLVLLQKQEEKDTRNTLNILDALLYVLFRWVLLQQKKKRTPQFWIHVTSFSCYFRLRKEIQ